MAIINIQKSLKQLDNDSCCRYDLLQLYENCNLSYTEKQSLVKLLHENQKPVQVYKYLKECFNCNEYNDDDDVSELLDEDTVKTTKGKWVNKGKAGTHGTFDTKKAADAQRKAMFASGWKGESFVSEAVDNSELEIRKKNYLKAKEDFETLGEKDNNDVLSREEKMLIAKAEYEKVLGHPIDESLKEESSNNGWVKRWNFLDNYYKGDLVISKISSPVDAWHIEKVAPNGHTIKHLGNYKSMEVAMDAAEKHLIKNESKSIKESFPRNINLDQVVMQVANLVDNKALRDDWIEVFPTRDARQSAGGEYFIPLEITGPEDITKKATFRTRNGRVEVSFLNGSEAMCDSAEEIARFIAGEFGLNLDESKSIKESLDDTDGWSEEIVEICEPFLERVEDVAYAIRNNRRGTSGLGDTVEELIQVFNELSTEAQEVSEQLERGDEDGTLTESLSDDALETAEQEISSAATSINSNKLPAVFKLAKFEPDTINLDYGGGRFDNAAEELSKINVTNLVYDPYNRSAEHNNKVVDTILENGGADSVTISNVLNVIKEPRAREVVLQNAKRLKKSNAPVYITVYEGDMSGEGKVTKAGYQLNRKTVDYIDEISKVFDTVNRKGKLIIAK